MESKKIEKARKELSDVCRVAGWDLKENDEYSQIMQIKAILKSYEKAINTIKECNSKHFLSERRAEESYNSDTRSLLDSLDNEYLANHEYFRKIAKDRTNPKKGFIILIDKYKDLVMDDKFSDLDGKKGEEADIEKILTIRNEVLYGQIRPFKTQTIKN